MVGKLNVDDCLGFTVARIHLSYELGIKVSVVFGLGLLQRIEHCCILFGNPASISRGSIFNAGRFSGHEL